MPGSPPARRQPAPQPLTGAEGELVFGYGEIDQQQVTNTLRISVTRDLAAAGACLDLATVSARLGFADTCGVWKGNAVQDSGKLTVLRGDLAGFSIRRVSQTVVAGAAYTWTLTAPNTGSGPAHNFVVTQTLPAGLEFITATVGSSESDAATPTVATVGGDTVITWVAASLPAGKTWRAVVAARPLAARTAYSISAEVHAACDDGGCQQGALSTSFNAPCKRLASRSATPRSVSAGHLSYTITADFYGSVPYTGTQWSIRCPSWEGGWSLATPTSTSPQAGAAPWTADTATPGVLTFTTNGGVEQSTAQQPHRTRQRVNLQRDYCPARQHLYQFAAAGELHRRPVLSTTPIR